jgi:putative nucleotidyltransferase with HDIG domain
MDRELALAAWIGCLAAAAMALALGLAVHGNGIQEPLAVAILAAVAVGVERQSLPYTSSVEASIASLVFVFAAVVFGPLAGMLVGAAGLLVDLPRRDGEKPLLRWLTWTSTRMLVAGFAGIAAMAVLNKRETGFLVMFAAVSAAFVVDTLLDIAFNATTLAIRGTSSWWETAASLAPSGIVTVPLHASMVAVLAYAYTDVSPWSVVLFAAPAFAAQRLLLLYRQQRLDTEALGVANERLERANLSFATALVATLDARDRYTAGHSAAVAVYARDIAQRMGLSESEQELVHVCGLVHDVGKIGLPAGLLEKPGALSLEERRQMEQHSIIGERILRNVEDYAEIAVVVRHHHERVDGNGYPDRLEGDAIPLLARIIAVADAYNAMTSDRPYRDAMPSRVARLRLAQAVESQFDTSVVAAFEAILASATEEYRMGIGSSFNIHSQHDDVLESWDSLALPIEAAALV